MTGGRAPTGPGGGRRRGRVMTGIATPAGVDELAVLAREAAP